MEEILEKLYFNLSEAFNENLKAKEIFKFEDNDSIDVLKTLLSLKKNNKVLNDLMLSGSISMDELKYLYPNGDINECLSNKYLLRGNSINRDKLFIGTAGLFKYYSLKNFNLINIFIDYDANNFILEKQLTLKSQEKIWCIFLLLFGADCQQNSFNSEGLSIDKLKIFHKFLISIEKEMQQNSVILGKKIGWDTGKDSSFRKFITNNVDLPKTPIYVRDSRYKYYLDLSKRKNVSYLLDLILDKYTGEKRLIINELFYNSLKELEYNMTIELGEMPRGLNKFLIEELKEGKVF